MVGAYGKRAGSHAEDRRKPDAATAALRFPLPSR
jgi:hypothetical protein